MSESTQIPTGSQWPYKPIIAYDGSSIVTASYRIQPGDNFGAAMNECLTALMRFQRSKPGSIWGCDGVGRHAQMLAGYIQIHKSGVGPRKFASAMKSESAVSR